MSPSICHDAATTPSASADVPAAAVADSAMPGATTTAAPPTSSSGSPSSTTTTTTPTPGVDWSRVQLGVTPAPTMFVAHWSSETCCWDGGALVPYGPLSLLPAAQVLNYGQSIFEGFKAYRRDATGSDATGPANSNGNHSSSSSGGGESAPPSTSSSSSTSPVLLFRPDANAARFAAGAERMCMPAVPPAFFLAAVHAVVRANVDWVPPAPRGSLYLRPLLLGTGALLGINPAPSYTFVVYAVPVGSRAKGGQLASLDYLIHDSMHRAAPRGVGSTKAAGNYSPCLLAQRHAREAGLNDCIYLDARSDTYLEEGTGCNVFAAHGSVLSTPPAAGSILPGITRASLLQLAGCLGYEVREAPVSVQQAMKADEMFVTGTAVVVQPIGSITYQGTRVCFRRQQENGGSEDNTRGATTTTSSNGSAVSVPAQAANGHHAANGSAPPPTTNGYHSANGHHASSATPTANGAGANGHATANGSGAQRSEDAASSSGSPIPSPTPGSLYPSRPYGYGRSVTQLTSEQLAALAAAAPPPDPASLPPGVGPVAQRLYRLLTGIQYGRIQDPFGWTVAVDMEGPTEGPLHLDRLLADEEECDAADGEDGQEEQQVQQQDRAADGAAVPAAKAGPLALSLNSFGSAAMVPAVAVPRAKAKGKGKAACGAGVVLPRTAFADANLE